MRAYSHSLLSPFKERGQNFKLFSIHRVAML
jgi:hypothetical protein